MRFSAQRNGLSPTSELQVHVLPAAGQPHSPGRAAILKPESRPKSPGLWTYLCEITFFLTRCSTKALARPCELLVNCREG